MTVSQKKIEFQELVKLMNVNQDAIEFYSVAQRKVESLSLVQTLRELEIIHMKLIARIQEHLELNFANCRFKNPHSTVVGSAHRIFGALEANVTSTPDSTLIRKLEEAENRCSLYWQSAIAKTLNSTTKIFLQKELVELRRAQDYMKYLKETIVA